VDLQVADSLHRRRGSICGIKERWERFLDVCCEGAGIGSTFEGFKEWEGFLKRIRTCQDPSCLWGRQGLGPVGERELHIVGKVGEILNSILDGEVLHVGGAIVCERLRN
jgi:hypothetical protein